MARWVEGQWVGGRCTHGAAIVPANPQEQASSGNEAPAQSVISVAVAAQGGQTASGCPWNGAGLPKMAVRGAWVWRGWGLPLRPAMRAMSGTWQ